MNGDPNNDPKQCTVSKLSRAQCAHPEPRSCAQRLGRAHIACCLALPCARAGRLHVCPCIDTEAVSRPQAAPSQVVTSKPGRDLTQANPGRDLKRGRDIVLA